MYAIFYLLRFKSFIGLVFETLFVFINNMARKSLVEREEKRRVLSSKYSSLRSFLKEKLAASDSFEQKLYYQSQLQKLPRNSSLSRLLRLLFSFIF